MDGKDEHLVYIDKGGTRRYYKNKKLHREVGPAYVCTVDVEKYTNLSDENLYKKVYEPIITMEERKTINLAGGIQKWLDTPITSTYYGSYYYLEGKKYSKSDFDTIMFKKKLDESLSQSEKPEQKRLKL